MDIPIDSEFIINSAKTENSKNVLKGINNLKGYELEKATQGFEAIFLNMLIKSMWKTIPESGLFEKNSSTQIYEGIIQTALSDEMARGGGLGMAKMLYQQLEKNKDD